LDNAAILKTYGFFNIISLLKLLMSLSGD
jgi:hypothetical protein